MHIYPAKKKTTKKGTKDIAASVEKFINFLHRTTCPSRSKFVAYAC